MRKIRLYFNKFNEAIWIKEMACKGYVIEKIAFFYTFKKNADMENIQMDYRVFSKNKDFISYLSFMADFGWKHIAGTKHSGSQYFIHKDSNSKELLYSNSNSSLERMKRFRFVISHTLILLTLFVFCLFVNGTYNINTLLNIKEMYYTPGLWESQGFNFWLSLLIETPFVFFRNIFPYGLIITLVIYLITNYKINIILRSKDQ